MNEEPRTDIKLPIGISDFEELIKGGYLFADKSLLIKDIIENGAKVILMTRPRHFGRTLNLSMLYYFFNKNHGDGQNLFEGLNISKDEAFCRKHQQQYPVIFITFKEVKQDSYEKAYGKIVELMSELYEEHQYLLEGDLLSEYEKNRYMALLNKSGKPSDIPSAIKQLTVYLSERFKKPPIILIDDYDTPMQEAYLKNYYDEMFCLMRNILGEALKDNKYIKQGILTGIAHIVDESYNNIHVCSILDGRYEQYFGLTEEEVLSLLKESKQEVSIASIKEWYNGYQVGKHELYNPYSIISCLGNNGILESYWVDNASDGLIAPLLTNAKSHVKFYFEKLLQGETIERPISETLVFPDLKTDEVAIWSLLLYSGYLKVLSSGFQGYRLMATIAIPNKEIRLIYNEIIAQ